MAGILGIVPRRLLQSLALLLLFLEKSEGFLLFTNPLLGPDDSMLNNPVYQIGTNMNITWNTQWSEYTFLLAQFVDEGDGYKASKNWTTVYTKKASEVETGYFLWNIDIGPFSLTKSNVFFFVAYSLAALEEYAVTDFNVTEDTVTTVTRTSTAYATETVFVSETRPAVMQSSASLEVGIPSITFERLVVATPTQTSTNLGGPPSISASRKSLTLLGLGVGPLVVVLITFSLTAAALFKVFKDGKVNGWNKMHYSSVYELLKK